MSLNGKIARKGGDISWLESLPNPSKVDYGFKKFYNSIDTTIQGYNTYALILKRGIEIPSKDKINYVLSRKEELKDSKYVKFIKDNPIQFIKNLKEGKGKDIWLIGGGKTNTLLHNKKLIDEIIIFIVPIILDDGIDLFEFLPRMSSLKLLDVKQYETGMVGLKYEIINGKDSRD